MNETNRQLGVQANGQQPASPPRGSRGWEEQEFNREEISEIVDSEVLDQATVDLLETLLVRDLPLGNLSEAEFTEFRYLLENAILKVLAEHPPQGSILQGDYRQLVLGDGRRTESALTGRQKAEIDNIKTIILNRATRGKEGWQQEKINEQRQIQKRYTETNSDGSGENQVVRR